MKKRIFRLLTVLIAAVVLISALNLNASAVIINEDIDVRDLEDGYIVRAGRTITNADMVFSRTITIIFYSEYDGYTYNNETKRITIERGDSYLLQDDILVIDSGSREYKVYILSHSTVKLHPDGGKFSDNTTGFKTIENVQGTPDNDVLNYSLL
ncbi:MAG: hypothetical protein II195_01415, partial [Selenomonadales bacterium]|nr:hypothetical protein [Selenomonadales bacterium]